MIIPGDFQISDNITAASGASDKTLADLGELPAGQLIFCVRAERTSGGGSSVPDVMLTRKQTGRDGYEVIWGMHNIASGSNDDPRFANFNDRIPAGEYRVELHFPNNQFRGRLDFYGVFG